MANYTVKDFDTNGYVEEISFKPLIEQCNVEFQKGVEITQEFKQNESFINQEHVQQNKLTQPKCKCLRK